EQAMSSAEECDEKLIDDIILPDDDFANFFPQSCIGRCQPADGLRFHFGGVTSGRGVLCFQGASRVIHQSTRRTKNKIGPVIIRHSPGKNRPPTRERLPGILLGGERGSAPDVAGGARRDYSPV